MDDDMKNLLAGFVMGFCLAGVLALNVQLSISKSDDNEAIKRGYKVYDAKTGELKWKESDDAK